MNDCDSEYILENITPVIKDIVINNSKFRGLAAKTGLNKTLNYLEKAKEYRIKKDSKRST